jgi:hypothetical protein
VTTPLRIVSKHRSVIGPDHPPKHLGLRLVVDHVEHDEQAENRWSRAPRVGPLVDRPAARRRPVTTSSGRTATRKQLPTRHPAGLTATPTISVGVADSEVSSSVR